MISPKFNAKLIKSSWEIWNKSSCSQAKFGCNEISMMTQGKKYSVSIMQTAHLDMKQPTNLYLHYAEQLEKAKKT